MDKFKLCAIVSSYFPNLEELEENIKSYLPAVDKLIIWENTPESESCIAELTQKLNSSKIEIRTTGKNEFLAKPFNLSIKWAKENDYSHILLMDQDSRFAENHFNNYLRLIQKCEDDKIVIFSPRRDDRHGQATGMVEIPHAITSGSIFSTKIFDETGMFREDFLIDAVDTEFCYRVRKNGYKVVCFIDIFLFHKIGYSIKKMGLAVQNYSAQRTYYIIRNHTITFRSFPKQTPKDEKFLFYKYKIFYRSAKIFLEKSPLKKIKAIIWGLFHGYSGRTGKYDI